jgi:hypothetical protein
MKTLNSLIETISGVINLRLSEYKAPIPQGSSVEDAIFLILQGASRVKNGNLIDTPNIKRAISWAVKQGVPINISLLWAIGAHARSSFKIIDWQYNIPRLGDIWALYWFRYLDQKIKTIYSPGIHIVLIDEVSLSNLMGWDNYEMNLRKNIFRELIPKDLKVSIFDLPDFPEFKIDIPALEDETLMVLTSSEMISTDLQISISEELYKKHDKSWEDIKEKVGLSIWNNAQKIVSQMSRIKIARKETNWISNFVFNDVPYIDGCILKKGRWSPDIWDSTSPQHGGSLLVYDGGRKFSIRIIPEFRLAEEKRNPFKVPISEFQELIKDPLPWFGEVMLYWT